MVIPTPNEAVANPDRLGLDAQKCEFEVGRLAGRSRTHGTRLKGILVANPSTLVVEGADPEDLAPIRGNLDLNFMERTKHRPQKLPDCAIGWPWQVRTYCSTGAVAKGSHWWIV